MNVHKRYTHKKRSIKNGNYKFQEFKICILYFKIKNYKKVKWCGKIIVDQETFYCGL